MRLSPAPVRSRMRGARTATGPRPVRIARSGRWPWRTSRWRPSSVCLSAWPLRKAATSASTACASRARAPSRRTSVSGSENSAGWISLTTLSWIMAYHSFGGEVEVSNTPTIRRLIPHAVTNFRAYLVLALREVEQRLRVADRLAACIDDPRAPDQITHALADIIRFRLLMIAAGYEDGNDAAELRRDPLFKMALDLAPSDRELCSQPTISRLENQPDVRSLLRMGRAMVDLYCASFRQVPKRIVLDIDDTFDAVHGGQQLRLFNAHYDEYGFQPIVVFDGEGRFVTAVLRPAKRPKGTEVRALLRRLLRAIRANWSATEILLRADSHYCG